MTTIVMVRSPDVVRDASFRAVELEGWRLEEFAPHWLLEAAAITAAASAVMPLGLDGRVRS